jgi:Helicase associated domain
LTANLDVESSRWLKKQRKKYKNGKLEKDKIKKLESIGVSWAPDDDFWDSMYLKASAIKPVNGKRHIPYDHPDKRLFNWATVIRSATNIMARMTGTKLSIRGTSAGKGATTAQTTN